MHTLEEAAVICKTAIRIIPFLFLLYIVSFIDRTNVGFAALQMNKDIGLTPAMYGLGARTMRHRNGTRRTRKKS